MVHICFTIFILPLFGVKSQSLRHDEPQMVLFIFFITWPVKWKEHRLNVFESRVLRENLAPIAMK